MERFTQQHISETKQEVRGKERDAVEGERLQAVRTARQIKDPDHHTAQAEVNRPTVHDDPIVTLFTEKWHKMSPTG